MIYEDEWSPSVLSLSLTHLTLGQIPTIRGCGQWVDHTLQGLPDRDPWQQIHEFFATNELGKFELERSSMLVFYHAWIYQLNQVELENQHKPNKYNS